MDVTNLQNLKALDSMLRCTICFDYFNVCMMTACSHNYCSYCIRKYLTYKAECPMCFEKASEPELRNNRLIDELVQQHVTLRNVLQKLESGPEHSTFCNFEENSKFSESESTPLASSLTHFSLSQNKDQKSPSQSTSESDTAFCPVCNVPVPIKNINSHLDLCLKRRSMENSTGSTEKRQPLPKVVYHLMSDKELKRRLMEFGLSTKGDRQVLAKRHKNFLVLYNSECDSLHPRPVSEIVAQVEREEKEEGQCPVSVFSYYDRRTDPSLISDEQENYMKTHKKQFDSLIEDVRSRKRQQSTEVVGTLNGSMQEGDIINSENECIKESCASSPELFVDEGLSNLSWNENTGNDKILPPPCYDTPRELSLDKKSQETKTDDSGTDNDTSSKERYIKPRKLKGSNCRKRRQKSSKGISTKCLK